MVRVGSLVYWMLWMIVKGGMAIILDGLDVLDVLDGHPFLRTPL